MNPVWIYVLAWLIPLASFVVLFLGGKHWGKFGGYIACGAIMTSFLLSAYGLYRYHSEASPELYAGHGDHGEHQEAHYLDPNASGVQDGADPREAEKAEQAEQSPAEAVTNRDSIGLVGGHIAPEEHSDVVVWKHNFDWITVGGIRLKMGFYVDSLTVMMFFMVTLIASLVHLYSTGYMAEELDDVVKDHHAVPHGEPALERQGRFPRFFTYLSLFCFSMLGLVIADNIFMVFIFWELVGVCSFLLIGFYYERNTASTAANKAFITNRVGDVGMIIGLMIILSTFYTFNFDDLREMVPGAIESGKITTLWLTVAGVGIFVGCMGKSAQFPLHVWLPDAMEGPTPVSALIHAATMVAAGVYLVGRFYFLFTADALLVIAYTGAITLFMAGTIAVVMTDIKKVLAYSTISQLGYMMLGLGVGGWAAGLFHLITHAFFKALLFLNSGSVIYGCHHEQEMPKMGGLWKKMPISCATMFVGVLAISGIPLFSGFYSKDSIIAHALDFTSHHKDHTLLIILPVVGAAITAFYMFRLFFMTFTGEPRDHHLHDHAHESPRSMWLPLVILAVPSVIIGYQFGGDSPLLERMISYHPPVELGHPSHEIHSTAGAISLIVVLFGIGLSSMIYFFKVIDPAELPKQFPRLHDFLLKKWYFDELYDAMLVKPAHRFAAFCTGVDRKVFDQFVDGAAKVTVKVSRGDGAFDRNIIDGLVNLISDWVYAAGDKFKYLQTGRLRQYLVYLVIGSVGLVTLVTYINFLDVDWVKRLLAN